MRATIAEVFGSGGMKWIALHGWFGPSLFDGMFADSDPAHQIAVVHNPGYGEARGEQPAEDMTDLAGHILAAVDELGWKRFGIIGHSYGAAAALRIASLNPGRVEAILGFAPVMPTGFDAIAAKNCNADDSFSAFLLGAYAKGPEAPDGMRMIAASLDPELTKDSAALVRLIRRAHADMSEDVYRHYLGVWAGCSFANDVVGLPTKALFVLGVADPFCAPNYVEPTVAGMADARWILVPGGHFPTISSPAECRSELRNFMGDRRVNRKNKLM